MSRPQGGPPRRAATPLGPRIRPSRKTNPHRDASIPSRVSTCSRQGSACSMIRAHVLAWFSSARDLVLVDEPAAPKETDSELPEPLARDGEHRESCPPAATSSCSTPTARSRSRRRTLVTAAFVHGRRASGPRATDRRTTPQAYPFAQRRSRSGRVRSPLSDFSKCALRRHRSRQRHRFEKLRFGGSGERR